MAVPESNGPLESAAGKPQPTDALVAERYKQMHVMRREYNRYIYQGPAITVAVTGATFGFLASATAPTATLLRLFVVSLALLVVAGFTTVMWYWVFRARILLKDIEEQLMLEESELELPAREIYPAQVNERLAGIYSGSSTRYIVAFQGFLAIVFFLASFSIMVSLARDVVK